MVHIYADFEATSTTSMTLHATAYRSVCCWMAAGVPEHLLLQHKCQQHLTPRCCEENRSAEIFPSLSSRPISLRP